MGNRFSLDAIENNASVVTGSPCLTLLSLLDSVPPPVPALLTFFILFYVQYS